MQVNENNGNIIIDDTESNQRCLEAMYVSDTNVYVILGLARCGKNSGKSVIDLIKKIAKQKGISQIIIDSDESAIYEKNVPLDLRKLSILTTGQSWYNKLGFHKNLNKQHLDKMYSDFAEYINNPIVNLEFYRPGTYNRHNITYESLKTLIDIDDNDTIQSAFVKINHELKYFDKNQLTLLSRILEAISIPSFDQNIHGLSFRVGKTGGFRRSVTRKRLSKKRLLRNGDKRKRRVY